MAKAQDINEAEVAAAVAEKRQDAVKLAVPQLLQIEREINAKNKRKAEIFQGLENRGIDKLAFKEALKRARRDSEQLDMFDEEAAALEPMIRDVLLGITSAADKKAAATAQEAEERQEKAKAAAKPKAAKEKAAAKPKAAKKAKKGAGSAEQGPTQGRQPEPVEGDPDFRQKIRRVAAAPGDEGLSADSLPMPGVAERPPQTNVTDISQARGFVDKTPRMSAADARRAIGADDEVLGRG